MLLSTDCIYNLCPCRNDILGTKLYAIMAELLDFTKSYILRKGAE